MTLCNVLTTHQCSTVASLIGSCRALCLCFKMTTSIPKMLISTVATILNISIGSVLSPLSSPGSCMDVKGSSAQTGSVLVTAPCYVGSTQLWKLTGGCAITMLPLQRSRHLYHAMMGCLKPRNVDADVNDDYRDIGCCAINVVSHSDVTEDGSICIVK